MQSILTLVWFCIHYICMGIYHPCVATLRSQYIPEHNRATVTSFLEAPLLIVRSLIIGLLDWLRIYPVESALSALIVSLPSLGCAWLVFKMLNRNQMNSSVEFNSME